MKKRRELKTREEALMNFLWKKAEPMTPNEMASELSEEGWSNVTVYKIVQALSEELYEDGIRINAINPERTATPMREKAFGQEPEDTLLKPEKVADTTLRVLLSSLTGEVIDVRRKDN